MAVIEMQPWSQKTLQPVSKPTLSTLMQQGHPWLWLNGTNSPTLDSDVAAISGRLQHHWLWRGTEWEYNAPGYREGPLLVPLDDKLLQVFSERWAQDSGGLIIVTNADEETLLSHLRNLRVLTAPDGNQLLFNIAMPRQLEELAEALSSSRWAQLSGPIHSLIWTCLEGINNEWLQARNPYPGPALKESGEFILTPDEEAALNRANHEWFMRSAAKRANQINPDLAQSLGKNELSQRLNIFIQEATGLGLIRERDAFHYLYLRLTHPQQYFLNDGQLRTVLSNRAIDARQRLAESEARLKQLVSESA
ncbi:DUF4123 domain-containing protein [Pseudomonas sp. Pse1]|uniref:DUF4123 domain-containing protein n=1 Tax=Pseudomonas sp. Pse1 TaxID=2926020 RepID=UPI002119AF96|nr:DUF4123 domain-containing protein [Pseudomonas sp. Pse1]